MKSKQKVKGFIEQIAVERMYRLIELAEENWNSHSERSKEYIGLIKKISSRNKASVPKEIKAKFCKKCNSFLNSKNSQIRIKQGKRSTKCLNCGAIKLG
ncbi:MAG: ribonuclease P [archaeon]|nr:ribonuclease P [archaeon]